jgi:hypothetical protein
MATILAYRRDGRRPYCELVLDSGERILVSLDASGASIERMAGPGVSHALLFRASPDTVAWICATLQQDRQGGLAEPLDLLVKLVLAMRSAEHVRAAFDQAVAGRERSAAARNWWPRWLRWR